MSASGQTPPHADPAAPSAPAAPAKIAALIIEDDPTTQSAMRVLLEHFGYQVHCARTAAEGMALLVAHKPRYVFLDLMLPDGDGAAVLEHVRAHNLETTVAVITGTNDPDRLRRVQHLQPDLFLRKPLDFLALLGQLRKR